MSEPGRARSPAGQLRSNASRVARVDLLTRIVLQVFEESRPPLASTVRAARVALDELRAMVADSPTHRSCALCVDEVERLARAAGLPEVIDHDYRRKLGMPMTEPEQHSWRLIEHFAGLVATATAHAAPSESSTSTSSAGLVDASPSVPANESNA